MKDGWVNLILLLLFILVPVVSALAKMLKDQIDKAKAENEKTFEAMGRKTGGKRRPIQRLPDHTFEPPEPLPEEAQAYESVIEHVRARPAEHVSETVRRDIEERVKIDLDTDKWTDRDQALESVGETAFDDFDGKPAGQPVVPRRMTPAALRRAIIMAEILAPPLALREREEYVDIP